MRKKIAVSDRQYQTLRKQMKELNCSNIQHLLWLFSEHYEETKKKEPPQPQEPIDESVCNRCLYLPESFYDELTALAEEYETDTRTIMKKAINVFKQTPPPQKKQRPLCDLCGKEIKTPPIILCEKCAPEVEL